MAKQLDILALKLKTKKRTAPSEVSSDIGTEQEPIHVVNAWATEQRLVLGQVKVHKKTNEITAIPELIKVLELSGCLVTIDAIGTQRDIVQLIQDKGADYCLALKKNQRHLHQRVVELFERAETQDWLGVDHDFHRTLSKGHGRTEIRRHWTMPVTELFFDEEKWTGLHSIGLIESVRKIDGETTTKKRYYLNSFSSDASLLAHAVRSHWGVENNVHWVLDVAFDEDDCPVHSDHAPENLSQLRKMALNLLSREKTAKVGIANKRCGMHRQASTRMHSGEPVGSRQPGIINIWLKF